MDARLPTALREKYRLVHVPGQRRCRDWLRATGTRIDEGLPAEQAGLAAAQAVFPYEAARTARPDSPPVTELLSLGGDETAAGGTPS